MTISITRSARARRALIALVVAAVAGATACGESPTAPGGTARAKASSGHVGGGAVQAAKRRAGYNVVAD
jgi:hypothetical protein